MPETKNNNDRHLIWIGCSIALCVSIAVFFWIDSKLFAEHLTKTQCEKNELMHKGIDDKFKFIKESVNDIKADIVIIKEKM